MNKASCVRAWTRFSPLVIFSFASVTLLFGGTAYADIGDDTFQSPVQFKIPGGHPEPVGIAAGDVNGDGNIDLVTANFNGEADSGGSTVSVALGKGDGTFEDPKSYPVNNDPNSVVVADLDSDGNPDAVVPNFTDATVSVLLNDAAGGYSEAPVTYATGAKPIFIAIGDVNADTVPDLIVADDTPTQSDPNADGTVSVLTGRGDGTFNAKVDYVTGNNPVSIAIGDLNGDDNPDIVAVNNTANSVSVLLNKGDGTFAAHKDYTVASSSDQATSPRSVAIGDFNGDDKADIAVANSFPANIAVLLGNGDGTLGEPKFYDTGLAPNAVVAEDVDDDGNLDLVAANSKGSSVSMLAGKGDGTFGSHVDVATGSGPLAVTAADFNGDDEIDLASADSAGDTVTVIIQAEAKEPPPPDDGGDGNGGDDNNNGGGGDGGGGAGSPLGLALLGMVAAGAVRRRYRGKA